MQLLLCEYSCEADEGGYARSDDSGVEGELCVLPRAEGNCDTGDEEVV